jgi:predicted HicB family RNase H-like nuclease
MPSPRKPAASAATEPSERVQLLIRIPRKLHRELKHAAVDRDTSLNELVLAAIGEWWRAQPEKGRYGR